MHSIRNSCAATAIGHGISSNNIVAATSIEEQNPARVGVLVLPHRAPFNYPVRGQAAIGNGEIERSTQRSHRAVLGRL